MAWGRQDGDVQQGEGPFLSLQNVVKLSLQEQPGQEVHRLSLLLQARNAFAFYAGIEKMTESSRSWSFGALREGFPQPNWPQTSVPQSLCPDLCKGIVAQVQGYGVLGSTGRWVGDT